jgi:hypothetical protein
VLDLVELIKSTSYERKGTSSLMTIAGLGLIGENMFHPTFR